MLQAPCLWIRDGGGAGVNGLDGIISGWMREGSEGWMEGRGGREGGAGYPRDSSKEDRMRETRRKKKRRTLPILLFFSLSKASVTAAEACLLLLLFSRVDI